MSIFNALYFIGGLAMFLYGMHIMGVSLERRAGGSFRRVLEKITSNPINGILLGTVVTAIIQSSSATTVMVVGFVNSGIMTLQHAVGVIMGANIGTAVTAWILSLTGLESDNFILQLFKPVNFSPIFAGIGICMILFSKKERRKDVGQIFLGFAILMYGMISMSDSTAALADVPAFTNILTAFQNPFLGVIAGTVITAIIQSSSASVGILQALTATGSISFATAVPIVMGQNIGTCVTALLSCAGTSANAKRAALIHLYFNLFGVIIFLSLFYLVNFVVGLPFLYDSVNALDIAVIHTVFKLFNTAVFLPFNKQLVHLAKISVKDSPIEEQFSMLDDRFLTAPAFAVSQCQELTKNMALLTYDEYSKAASLLTEYSDNTVKYVEDLEEEIDAYEDKLGTFLVNLSSKHISESDSHEVSRLLHIIGDLERIGDHALNISESCQELHDKKIVFTDSALHELDTMFKAVDEAVSLAVRTVNSEEIPTAVLVEPLEQVIDVLNTQIRSHHIERLQKGECTMVHGFVLSDMITDLERIADHCSNIAVCMIEMSRGSLETHEYLNSVKNGSNAQFAQLYNEYSKKYSI